MSKQTASTEGKAEQSVLDFCNTVARMDVDAILDFFANDAVYEKIPMAVFEGKDAIRKTFVEFFGNVERVEFEVKEVTSSANTVMMERITHFGGGGKDLSLRIMSIFKLQDDGKIVAWRDYYDRVQAGMAPNDSSVR